jgi:hypothetical protein
MAETKQIKLFLVPPDHDRVRLAAALRRTTMTNFCRQVVLAEAGRLTQGLPLGLEDDAKAHPTSKFSSKRSKNL